MADQHPKPTTIRPAETRRHEFWRGFVPDDSSGFRKFFSRDNLISNLKTLAWVLPLSALIWIYAEREQVATDADVLFPVTVKSSNPERIITLLEPENRTVRTDLAGPRARLDAVRQALEPRDGQPAVQIEIDDSLSPGEHEISTVDQVARDPIFARRGISVTKAMPQTLRIYVDEIVDRDARVLVPPEVNNLDGPATFDPPIVTVRGPRRLLEEAAVSGQLAVYAALTGYDVLRSPGAHDLPDVSLIRSPALQDEHVSLSTTKVRAGITVRQANVEYTIPSMPVFVAAPQGTLDLHTVSYDPVLSNVTVVGPPEQIELLREPDFAPKPKAQLEVTREDVGGQRSRRVRYLNLPEGVQVVEQDSRREVQFELIPRSPGDL